MSAATEGHIRASASAELQLSLVIPIYRESKRMRQYFADYIAFLDAQPQSELVFVDDGSDDDTKQVARKLAQSDERVRVFALPKHIGKGVAWRTGVLNARGRIVLLSDCDLSTPLSEYSRLLPMLAQYDLIIGSRRAQGANLTKHQPLLRQLGGYLASLLIRQLTGLKYKDTQCGFKLLGPACLPLVAKTRLTGAGFDFELLLRAEKADLRIHECGVEWGDTLGSRFGLRSFLTTLGELIRLRFWALKKKI